MWSVLLRRAVFQDRCLVGAVVADSGGEELPRLHLGGASWQVGRDEMGRFEGAGVYALMQSISGGYWAQLSVSFAATPLLLKKIFAQLGHASVMGSATFVAISSEYALRSC